MTDVLLYLLQAGMWALLGLLFWLDGWLDRQGTK